MRLRLLFLVFLSAGLLAFWQQPATVQISFDAYSKQVKVSPSKVTINAGEKVRWTSSGDTQARVEIDFDSNYGKKGPFPQDGSSDNPSRGRYKKKVGSPILTMAAADKGEWKYTVTWYTADGTAYPLDPLLVVK